MQPDFSTRRRAAYVGVRFTPARFILLMLLAIHGSAAHATAQGISPTAPAMSTADARAGGVVQHSYAYHRQPPVGLAHAAPTGPWYGYGFPVQTHRWGWFGAGRYYPTMIWHRGYYGDILRWGYRRGY